MNSTETLQAAPVGAPVLASQYLICGGRRTGTTLLAAILSSDERTNPLGQEAQFLTRLIEGYRWGRQHFEQFGTSYFGKVDAYRRFYADTVSRFSRDIADRISPGGILVLKNPEFAKVFLDLVDLVPESQLLVTVRDPRDQVSSEMEVIARRLAAQNLPPNRQGIDVTQLAHAFLEYYTEILQVRESQPDRLTVVRYEDLVIQADETIAELRQSTGLDLTFDPTKPWKRVVSLAAMRTSPSRSDLYGSPIVDTSVGRYKRDLNDDEAFKIQQVCGEFMNRFDYT